jgi:hypothetical protein
MNRLEDAVEELLTKAPSPPSVDALQRRARARRRRHRLTGGSAVAIIVVVALLVVVTTGGNQRRRDVRVVAPTSTQPQVASTTIPASSLAKLRSALQAWALFPEDATPRPLVLTSDSVAGPESGFATTELKEAFFTGLFIAPSSLPTGPREASGYPVISAADALELMRAEGTSAQGAPTQPPPLVISDVRFGSSSFETDRGAVTLPAWFFSFDGVQYPAAVLAVAPSAEFHAPAATGGPGLSARLSADGRTVSIRFVGGPSGDGPCSVSYTVDQLESAHAVAVIVREMRRRSGGNAVNCTSIGYSREATIVLDAPLGNRPLVGGETKAAADVHP